MYTKDIVILRGFSSIEITSFLLQKKKSFVDSKNSPKLFESPGKVVHDLRYAHLGQDTVLSESHLFLKSL